MVRLPAWAAKYAFHSPAQSGPSGPAPVHHPIPRLSVYDFTEQIRGVPLQPGQAQIVIVGSPYTVQAWGAAGGSSGNVHTAGLGGSGSGGGEFAQDTVTLSATGTLTITIGAGGTAGTTGVPGGTGGNTTVTGGSVTVTAHGGTGGVDSSSGGTGGTGSTNTIHFNGGSSVVGTGAGSSGGGSSAGPGGAGTNGAVTAGGIAPAGGGNGANGIPTSGSGPGLQGSSPGGGSGGATTNGVTDFNGAAGAPGKVVILSGGGVVATFTTPGTFSWVAPAAAVSVGPQGLGTTWYPQVANVGTTTGANDTSTVQLYYGPMAALQLISGTSYAGGGDAIGLPVPPVTPGYFIVAVWSGANPGDVATLNVIGTQTALTRAAS